MTSVKGRRWPDGAQMVRISTGDGQTYQRDGFVYSDPQPGDFQLVPDDSIKPDNGPYEGLRYICPRTGRYCGEVYIGLTKPQASPSWQWDGNTDEPTLSPSINCSGGCGWHGHLRKGVFEEC